jgi:hypothetical protein
VVAISSRTLPIAATAWVASVRICMSALSCSPASSACADASNRPDGRQLAHQAVHGRARQPGFLGQLGQSGPPEGPQQLEQPKRRLGHTRSTDISTLLRHTYGANGAPIAHGDREVTGR